MRITVTIPDTVADHYQAFAEKQGTTVEDVAARQLIRFRKLEPGQTAVVVSPSQCATLEARTGGLPFRDGDDLVTRVERIARIDFEHLEIRLTPSQREELAHRARRSGRTVEHLTEEIWKSLEGQFFYASGGGEAAVHPVTAPAPPQTKTA